MNCFFFFVVFTCSLTATNSVVLIMFTLLPLLAGKQMHMLQWKRCVHREAAQLNGGCCVFVDVEPF